VTLLVIGARSLLEVVAPALLDVAVRVRSLPLSEVVSVILQCKYCASPNSGEPSRCRDRYIEVVA
jgi:hypothetical protein